MNAEVLIKFKGDTSDVEKDVKVLDNSFGKLTRSFTLGNLAAKGISKGLEVMSQNLDGAIKRVDTMNNFPKVMKNFGVSSEDANESIKRIDKSVQGLPTSLDQAVAGVQDLFMVTKDLKQSEKLFQAINDSAMVFANGSTEAVDRFIYGYKQALAAGKVSAQDFNQMNEAIPGLMSKVAEKMGVSYKELKDGLSNGSISIEQFNKTLKLLDTEGVGAMESLQKGAKTSTGGFQTAISNMKTAFVRGVGNIVTETDKALKPMGGLSGVISKIGKVGEQAFKFIGAAIKDVLPTLIQVGKDVMPPLVNTFKSLMPVIQKLGATLLPAISTILAKLLPAISQIAEGLMPLIVTTLDALTPVIDPLVEVLSAVIDYVMAMINPLMQVLQVILPPIVSILSNLAKVLLPLLTGWLKFVAGAITTTFGIVKGFVNGIKAFLDIVINFIKDNWQSILLFFLNPFAGAFKFLYDKCEGFRNFVNGFVSAVVGFFKSIPGKIKSFATGIVDVFKNIPNKLLNIGKDIVKGLWNGIKGMKTWVLDKVKGFGKSILNGLKGILGIHSPSTEFALIGKFSVLGYTETLDKMSKDVDKQLNKTFGLNPSMTNSMQNTISPNIQVYNDVNIQQDPLGQMVRTIKTYSGGSPNDYNYGAGV